MDALVIDLPTEWGMIKTLKGKIDDNKLHVIIPLPEGEIFKAYNGPLLPKRIEKIEQLPHDCMVNSDFENICITYDHINIFSKNIE